MRYLKGYKLYESKNSIEAICKEYGIYNYTINEESQQWNVFGNEGMEEWTVGERTKTRGGQDAVVLSKTYVESSKDGKTYSKEYADANGIKYDNTHTVEHIVPLSELSALETTPPKSSALKDVEGKKADIERRRQEELKNAGLAADLRSIISKRLIKEGVSQEERNKLIGTQSSPIITSATSKDISNLLISYENNKNKQLEEFNKQGEGFNPSTGNFVNNDTSFWDNKIDNLNKINAKYDAELAVLKSKTQTISNQSEIETKKADIERRRKEDNKKSIRYGNSRKNRIREL